MKRATTKIQRPAALYAAIAVHLLPAIAGGIFLAVGRSSPILLFVPFSLFAAVALWFVKPWARTYVVRLPLVALAFAGAEAFLATFLKQHTPNGASGETEALFAGVIASYALLAAVPALLLLTRKAKAAFRVMPAPRGGLTALITPCLLIMLPAIGLLIVERGAYLTLWVYAVAAVILIALLLLRLPAGRVLLAALPVALWLATLVAQSLSLEALFGFWSSTIGAFAAIYVLPLTLAALFLFLPEYLARFAGKRRSKA